MRIHEAEHRCGHLFAVRNNAGGLDADSFSFCRTACGDASWCHHHSDDYVDVQPQQPRQPVPTYARNAPPAGGINTLDALLAEVDHEIRAETAAATELSEKRSGVFSSISPERST